jgi:hypothetical protein
MALDFVEDLRQALFVAVLTVNESLGWLIHV